MTNRSSLESRGPRRAPVALATAAVLTAVLIACLAPQAGAAPVPSRCRASALTGKVLTPFDGAAGTFGTVVVLTNRGTHPCYVSGRPKIALFAAGGAQLAAHQSATPGAIHRVLLAHGGRAGASLIWHGSPDESGPISSQCDEVAMVRVTPSGAGGHVTITGTALGGGLQICDPPGAFRVGPLGPPPFAF
ncbi:MAG TPA: DUF4232 domain-containing protein [Solirubrobacteraceae bacterium]|jgi:hypothetical protein|nr:DUF4232 domain-containing protein [Solirubrobacteraceae bacterium]